MWESFLIISRVLNVLFCAFLIINAGIALTRVHDPALKYGRISLGLIGLGLLSTHVERQFGNQLGVATSWVVLAGLVFMIAGAYRLVRLYWKFPEVRYRSLNLLGVRE